MRKVAFLIGGVALNLLLNITAGLMGRADAIRYSRWGWLILALYATYLLLTEKRIKKVVDSLRLKVGERRMLSYIVVGLLGASLAVLYWAVINGVYARMLGAQSRAGSAQHAEAEGGNSTPIATPSASTTKPEPTTPSKPANTEQSQLARLEFVASSNRPLKEFTLRLQLDREYTPKELERFRVLIEIRDFRFRGSGLLPTLWLGCRSAYPPLFIQGRPQFGILTYFASQNPNEKLDITVDALDGEASRYHEIVGRFEVSAKGPFKTLDDLNYKIPLVYISDSLVGKIKELRLTANNYVIIKTNAAALKPEGVNPTQGWPSTAIFKDEKPPLKWRALILGPANGPREAPRTWMFDFEQNLPIKELGREP
jgi:hypothetical protein